MWLPTYRIRGRGNERTHPPLLTPTLHNPKGYLAKMQALASSPPLLPPSTQPRTATEEGRDTARATFEPPGSVRPILKLIVAVLVGWESLWWGQIGTHTCRENHGIATRHHSQRTIHDACYASEQQRTC